MSGSRKFAKQPSPTAARAVPARGGARPVIGVALGSGAARGWTHIGVLQGLRDLGIEPQVVCGSSMGALVGASYLSGNLDALAEWASKLRRSGYLRFVELRVPDGGLVRGARLMEFLERFIPDVDVGDLPRPYGAVATDLASGREVWLRDGRLLEAVRASIAIPGLLTPVLRGERWLLDGGLVNPVPVSLCRALGAHLVIGVNPFGDRLSRLNHLNAMQSPSEPEAEPELELEVPLAAPAEGRSLRRLRLPRRLLRNGPAKARDDKRPGVMDVMLGSLAIMQDRITRSRMAGDPPDVLLAPRISHIHLLDFDRAEEAIAEGRACVQRMLPALQDVVGL